LPFRFIAAARAVPRLEAVLDQAMKLALAGRPRLIPRRKVNDGQRAGTEGFGSLGSG
jgi:hypothetical protein